VAERSGEAEGPSAHHAWRRSAQGDQSGNLAASPLRLLSNVERYQLLRGAAEDARNAGYSLRNLLPQLPALNPAQ
jgi:hypothetical protein